MEAAQYLFRRQTSIAILALIFIAQACAPSEKSIVTVQGIINQDTTWNADTIYVLDQQVQVVQGATLTIEPGTLIKAKQGEYPNASMLIIAKGSKINAAGTAQKPIIFTSFDDNIMSVGESSQTVLSENNKGLWGGIIILGNAPISTATGDQATFYIGLDPNDPNSYYGGENPEDNSGVLKYVSIRYGGTYMGTGSESNGLTLCGVGNKTTIDQIEIYANQDDGIEFFGGTVNASNIMVYSSGDDGIDIDEGYSGKIKNVMVVLGEQSDSGIEISGGKGDFTGDFNISEAKLMVHTPMEDQRIMSIDEKSKGTLETVLATNFLDVSKIELSSTEVILNALQITKKDKLSNSMDEISGGVATDKQVKFSDATELDNQKGFDWTLAQQKVSH